MEETAGLAVWIGKICIFYPELEGQFTQNPSRNLFAMTKKGLFKNWLGALRMPKRNVFRIIALYEGDSNENLKSAIKIKKTARLSCKLTIMILMV
jgi:hypothetical protein